MAIDFPNSPATNDSYTSGGRTWLYNGTSWTLLTLTQTVIPANSIVNANINSAAAIALSKLASGTSGQIIVANSSGVPTWVSESGDITISDTGVTAIASNTIVNADINSAAAIATTKITGWEDDQVILAQQVFG